MQATTAIHLGNGPEAISTEKPHAIGSFRSYAKLVRITFDSGKRNATLDERGLDFEDAALVFEGPSFEVEDTRQDYGEHRIIFFGLLHGRMVVVGYVPRGDERHIFSMRKANEREQRKISSLIGI
jgi:uncharacterized protein